MPRGFSSLTYRGFTAVFRPWLMRQFDGLTVSHPQSAIPDGMPVMLVANHVSWWDGFLLMELHRELRPRAPFHAITLETELARHPFLRKIGAIGIDPNRPTTIRAAIREVVCRTDDRRDSMIFFFPQGRIYPSFRRPLGFKRGVELFSSAIDDLLVIPVGIHIEPLNRVKPHAFVRAGEAMSKDVEISASLLEASVEHELDVMQSQLAREGEGILTPR